MSRIAYVDHSYHSKTLSTLFIPEILRERGHSVDFFWDESWKGDPAVPFCIVQDYDVVIMFQCRCESNETYFKKLHPNVIHIPMLDSFGIHYGPLDHLGWYFEYFQGCKILSFSTAIHAIATSFGIRSFFAQYYQPPFECIIEKKVKNGFFWIRHENHVSWPIIRTLLGDTKLDSLHLHIATDPGSPEPSLPTEVDIQKYNIITTNWFNEKKDFLKVLNNANIFFAPRYEEGIGQSFLEAMARGQCVVAPNFGTMNEYIIHGINGLLYDPKNPLPINLSSYIDIGNVAYHSVKIGYDRWIEAQNDLVDFILTPSDKLYIDLYQHDFNNRYQKKILNTNGLERDFKVRIKKIMLIRKTERFWKPVWFLIKKIHKIFSKDKN